MTKLFLIACAALAMTACATPGKPSLTAKEQRGLQFAQAHCAQCHGVTAGANSANPESPSFEAIANMPGLTQTSLRQFLQDSHNFPAAMNFSVAPAQVDALAAYVVTLRQPGYTPDI